MKKDILAAAIIGEIDAWVIIGISKNVGLDFPLLWLAPLVLPILTVFGIYVADFLGRKFLFIFQLAKFLLTGTLNAFIDLGILNLLMWIFGAAVGMPYTTFKAVSASAAIVNSYFWNKFWTFKKKETKAGAKEFFQFFLITGVGFFLNVAIASLLVNVLGPQFGLSEKLWANVGAIIAAIFVCSWNFLNYKFVVFKK